MRDSLAADAGILDERVAVTEGAKHRTSSLGAPVSARNFLRSTQTTSSFSAGAVNLSESMPGLRFLLCGLAAACGFLAVAAPLRAAMIWPGGAGVREKWAYFLEHADVYDVLLFGSSRVYRSFAPREMELEWKRHGRNLRAFNLAAPGVGRFEANAMLSEVLERRPSRLVRAVVELSPWDPGDLRGNESSRRAVHWHTLEGTRNALESCFTYPGLGRAQRANLAIRHVHLCVRRLTNFGRGVEMLDALQQEANRTLLAEARLNGGYRSLEAEAFSGVRERRAAFITNPDLRVEPIDNEPLAQLNLAAIERQVRAARTAGVEVVFVVPPGSWSPPEELRLSFGPPPPVISYSDRERYREFYSREALFDGEHISEESALELSRLFARDLMPYLP